MSSHGECGRYHRYKAATNAVLEWARRATKPKTKNAKKKAKKHGGRSADVTEWSVSQIYAAALEVVEAALPVPAAIMRQLANSIRLRYQAICKLPPDQGHKHMLDILRAIELQWTPLVVAPTGASKPPASDTMSGDVDIVNAFEALATDDNDDDDDADMWARLNATNTPLPPFDMAAFVAPVDAMDAERAALEARLEDEKFQILCFLLDVDDMNREVMLAWGMFKGGHMSLMAATAVTNACVHAVQVLGNDMIFAHPHLKDLDHMMALLVCDQVLVDLVADAKNGVSLKTAVELVVVAKRAMVQRLRPAAERTIAQRLKVPTVVASRVIDIVHLHFAQSDAWSLDWTSSLGNKNGFISLQHALFSFLEVITPGHRMMCRPGTFGPDWDERRQPAASPMDLYQTFFANILPALVLHVRDTSLFKLEYEATMKPLLVLIKAYVKSKEVPVALVFACQSVLWSLFFTQSSAQDGMSCAKVVDDTRSTLARVTRQMQALRDNKDGILVPPPTKKNVEAALGWLTNLRIATSADKYFTQMEVDRAWFNPYMAGQIFLTLTMEIGFSMGLATMDDIGQTRMVLHLYNALRVLDKVPPNEDLDNLATMFERGKSIWVGGRPTARGDFAKAHLLAWGYDATTAAALAANLRHDADDFVAKAMLRDKLDHRSEAQKKKIKRGDHARKLQATEPAPVSKAYRYVAHLTAPVADEKRDWTHLPRLMDILDVIHSDVNTFLYFNLNTVGQLFRDAWKEMVTLGGFKGNKLVPERGITDGPWRETDANIRLHNENLYFETLLGLCDRDPDNERLLMAAVVVMHAADRMPEAYLEAPVVTP
ncbi:hypothetical protein SDRG_11205 [Saprolegnia diclina VS20]|uniref:DUF6604 domain-containing protein n=1 Tax=Saprolegnia diclina (strain VS20) TaxID=1156394 RepID=T0RFF4_SAPDV|nr:hypothetical protein SDRG_11205 [Saprolegnia diclina VS20]EQC31018.1 hypothetical protein SDRG_11205 [Saprolegnia diclina VS20]|eukprot:XP_008615457.1 hypothetical protein SDRG_11205 [Saprolegnia diclina VS20]